MSDDPRPQSADIAVRLVGVTKQFGSVRAVDDLRLEVRAGELLVLLGASGSGKSTILGLVAGFTRPSSGRIILDGQDVTQLAAHMRDIGMVFQDYALFPHLTVAQNVSFPLEVRKLPKAQRADRVAAALEIVRLAGLGDRFPRELSGGQRQRVALARAVIYRPRVLLMDEPLGALDKHLREALHGEIRRLHAELGVTVIYVTHDQEEALALADRVALVEQGRIVQLGTGEELYERPSSAYVASFVGESNLFGGTFDPATTSVAVGPWRFRGVVGAGTAIAPGEAATLVVRPERIRISPASHQPEPGADKLAARVNGMTYLGHSVRYELAAIGWLVVARVGANDRAAMPAIGDDVWLHWRPADATIVPGLADPGMGPEAAISGAARGDRHLRS